MAVRAFVRPTLRVIRMISELHRAGYQRVRFMPYEAPAAFRVGIGPASLFSQRNGIELCGSGDRREIHYSSASERSCFGWTDAEADNVRRLAKKFEARFPEICRAGRGRDWAYAGWLCELLGVLEQTPGALPLVLDEYTYSPDRLSAVPFRLYIENDYSDHDIADAFPLPPPVLE